MPSIKSQNVLVIAEAGVNHNGDLEQARRLIDVAASAGADLVKFQTFDASHLATSSADLADYQSKAKHKSGSPPEQNGQLEMLRKLQLSRDDHLNLISHCKGKGIDFFSTAFDISSLEFLRDLGAQRFKIPSGEITNLPYLRKVVECGHQIIMSTGMADLNEVSDAIRIMEAAGLSRENLTLLHCTSEYPAPIEEVNLRAMRAMGDFFGVRYGYSDHTDGIDVAVAAVALGASVIEKHFTLDKTAEGPDHAASLDPEELSMMVAAIRRVSAALGSEEKQCTASERRNLPLVRKSIVAARDIAAGELFSDENLTVKRPATGLSPMVWDEVIGHPSPRSFVTDELIQL